MKKGLTYMLIGASIGAGALIAYNQMKNGNMKRAINNVKDQAQNKLGNMM